MSHIVCGFGELTHALAQRYLPKMKRAKAYCFGAKFGRNELIAIIVSVATGTCYGRKNVSSHSQTIANKRNGSTGIPQDGE